MLGADPHRMHTAYSLESALDELVFIVGPVLATLLATGVAPTAGLVVPLVAMLVGGYWFLSLRRTEPPPAPVGSPRPKGSVLRKPGMVVLAIVFVAMGSIFGATDVSTVAFAEESGSKGAAGIILAIFALGSLISGLLYGTRTWKRPLYLRFATGMVALAVGVCFFFLVESLAALAAVMFVAGFAIAPTLINGNGLVQDLVPRERLTEGLTWVGTSLGVGVSVGSSVAGAQIDANGSHAGFLVVVISAGAAVVATLAALRTLRGDAGEHVHDSVEAESPSATGGAAVAACEIAESVEPARSVYPRRVIDALASLVAPLGVLEDAELLTGGQFATTYRVTLADGARVVVKTAPTRTDQLLAYEHDLLRAEALVYELAASRPAWKMPQVLLTDFSRTVLPSDALVVSHLPGVPLVDAGFGPSSSDPRTARAERETGAVLAALHGLTGPVYGYPCGRQARTWTRVVHRHDRRASRRRRALVGAGARRRRARGHGPPRARARRRRPARRSSTPTSGPGTCSSSRPPARWSA